MDGFQYTNTVLNFFPHAEGYVNVTQCPTCQAEGQYRFNYVYQYKDHLGNIRVSYGYDEKNQVLKIIEESHYYPFGLKHTKYNTGTNKYQLDEEFPDKMKLQQIPVGESVVNKYRYNSKEFQDELGLNVYDYGARMYDPAKGRWDVTDGKSELYFGKSPYAYASNTPVQAIDPDGNLVIFINGMHTGDGGKADYWRTIETIQTSYRRDGKSLYRYNQREIAFDTAVMNQLGDHHAKYLDGAMGGISGFMDNGGPQHGNLSSHRRLDDGYYWGKSQAKSIIESLKRDKTTGEIVETIKIITHSMGGAWGKGYVMALQEYIKTLPKELQYQIKITLVADFDPFEGSSIKANKDIYTQQFTHQGGIFGLADEKQEGVDDYHEKEGAHSIMTYFDDVSKLQEGTYKWNGSSWVCTTCKK